jgi:hypothetical protein
MLFACCLREVLVKTLLLFVINENCSPVVKDYFFQQYYMPISE